jgi:hypothetical protein
MDSAQDPRLRTRSRRPALKIRRFGNSDFERFDEESARGSHVCVGRASIGKVEVDCKYHWRKAQWGVLGQQKNPAGIIYMDITFKQPHGYSLQNATVYITLGEDNPHVSSEKGRPGRKQQASLTTAYSVQMTDHFGPRFLTGTETLMSEIKTSSFMPTFGAAGFELGGVGIQSAIAKDRISRWKFKGTVARSRDGEGFRTLEWELVENELDPQQAHSQIFHTGFAFEHSQRPVFMRVEVQGRLKSKGRQLKHGALRFSSSLGKKDNATITEIGLTKTNPSNQCLDAIAEGLDMAMQQENYSAIPIVVPEPTMVSFTTQSSMTAVQNSESDLDSASTIRGTQDDASIEALMHHLQDQPTVIDKDTQVIVQGVELQPVARFPKNHRIQVKEGSDESLQVILQVPAILAVLKLIALMLTYFGREKENESPSKLLNESDINPRLREAIRPRNRTVEHVGSKGTPRQSQARLRESGTGLNM